MIVTITFSFQCHWTFILGVYPLSNHAPSDMQAALQGQTPVQQVWHGGYFLRSPDHQERSLDLLHPPHDVPPPPLPRYRRSTDRGCGGCSMLL